jgi:hypothetical protein
MWWKRRLWVCLGAVNVLFVALLPVMAAAATRGGMATARDCTRCHGFWSCLKCVICAITGESC